MFMNSDKSPMQRENFIEASQENLDIFVANVCHTKYNVKFYWMEVSAYQENIK